MFLGGSLWLAVFSLGCSFSNSVSYFLLLLSWIPTFTEASKTVLHLKSSVASKVSAPPLLYPPLYVFLPSEACRRLTVPITQVGILAHAFPPGTMREIAFATFGAGAPLGGSIGLCLGAVMTQLTA
jgi:hypothetical protein